MLINRTLPALRRTPGLGIALGVVFICLAVAFQFWFPALPPFILLFPALLLSALVGGKWGGSLALLVGTIAGSILINRPLLEPPERWHAISLGIFILEGGLIVLVILLLDTALERLQHERLKLDLVLRAAKASTWELEPGGKLTWDKNFYELVGLRSADQPPSADTFLQMVHPDERPKMAEARRLMDEGKPPTLKDEYRLIRPDGETVWLENHRVVVNSGRPHFVGITQDITTRKNDEEQIRMLLHELAHRAKNQFAVIARIAKETYDQADDSEGFDQLFRSRMLSMARFQDVLAGSEASGVDLGSLLRSQIDVFGLLNRVDLQGVPIGLAAKPAMYLGMAFHELCTNAAKYGAFSCEGGRVAVAWNSSATDFTLTWSETGGPPVVPGMSIGFGSKVLTAITPSALQGTAQLLWERGGLKWVLRAPLHGLRGETGRA